MNEEESKAAEVIVKNIELLESAYDFANTKMDTALLEAVKEIIEKKQKILGWDSEFGSSLKKCGPLWLAPDNWRIDDTKHYLYSGLSYESNANTHIVQFTGGSDRCVSLSFWSEIKTATLKQIFPKIQPELDILQKAGFLFDSKKFEIKLPIKFDREKIIAGFADDDLITALAPLEDAIDKVNENLETLNRIMDAIKGTVEQEAA